MDTELISKSLCFHGQPLQKIWEGERGSHDLSRLGLSNPDYSIYTQRQKNLTFQDRAKRLRLHQFLARKAEDLYDADLVDRTKRSNKPKKDVLLNTTTVVMPPFEIFANKHADKSKYVHHNLDAIKPGDVVFGSVTSRSGSGLLVKVICTGEPLIRYLFDIKAFVLAQNLIQAIDKKGISRPFAPNDHVCCEVLDISADADRMTLGMKGVAVKNPKVPLGLISADQYPEYYKRMVDDPHNSYEDYLKSAKQFENPNYAEPLYDAVGLDIGHAYSNMKTLKYRFPQAEYADELRQLQASKWAFRSVADGIEHFKIGRHTEAFQCLNKALNIDACNVEGLVARGALYANSGSFQKAVHDFETALKLNPYHANARRYMGETLVALGRSFEEDQRYEDARKAYKSCLDIIPSHEEAQSSLDTLNANIPPQLDTNNFMFSGPIPSNSIENELFAPASRPDIKNNKYNEFKESSSSSESDSGSSNESSSNSNHSKYSDKNKNRRSFKPSLSPLSKRMVEMEPSGGPSNYQFNQPFHLSTVGTSSSAMVNEYENKFQQILDYNRDDDYDDKVRKLLEETNHRKDYDDNYKSKEKRKHKNDTKENKKDKIRDNETVHHPSRNEMNHFEIEDNIKMVEPHSFSNNIESKSNDNLQKYEENIEKIPKVRPETTFINHHMFDVHKISTPSTTYNRQSSPPFPPYMHLNPNEIPTPVPSMHMIMPNSSPYVSNMKADGTFKPFPIKAPIVLDKFGCFRLATAPENDIKKLDRSSYRSRSRSRSRGRRVRSRSRSRNRRSRSRRRFRSRSRSRYHSRSPVRRTRLARSRSRRKSRSNSLPARRTPSPFVPRHTPPPQRYRRSRSPFRSSYRGSYRGSFRSFHPRGRGRGRGRSFYTFVKKRSPLSRNRSRSRSRSRSHTRSRTRSRSLSFEDKNRRSNFNSSNKTGLNSRWEHDKYVKDDPTIEEIDEIINKAQRDRKKEIIQRDRSIVKNK